MHDPCAARQAALSGAPPGSPAPPGVTAKPPGLSAWRVAPSGASTKPAAPDGLSARPVAPPGALTKPAAPAGVSAKPAGSTGWHAKSAALTGGPAGWAVLTGGPTEVTVELTIALVLVALVAGFVVGSRAQSASRPPVRTPPPEPRDRAGNVIRVLGYVTGTRHGDREALAGICDARGWTMLKLVKETKPQLPGLVHRPSLMYALEELRFGTADGLVVAHLSDLTTDFADLVTVIRWVTGAGRFLAAADHPLDTSTEHGRLTAQALLGLGNWQRNRAIGRFAPPVTPTREGLGPGIDALRERGIPDRAIADALAVAGIPAPPGHARWHPAAVRTLVEPRDP